MRDLELVIRFFALSEHEKMEIKFKDYLSEFMDVRNDSYVADPNVASKDETLFVQAVTNTFHIFRDDAFS